jgi:hypothetical protein
MAVVAEPPKRAAPAAGGDVTPEKAGGDAFFSFFDKAHCP